MLLFNLKKYLIKKMHIYLFSHIALSTGGGSSASTETFTVASAPMLPINQQGEKLIGTGST
ncbi:MAG: hypothetical protein K9J25_13530 [Bacteroidales bacterium]|nr:hypothetical protein [Bacteroidales bacterium]